MPTIGDEERVRRNLFDPSGLAWHLAPTNSLTQSISYHLLDRVQREKDLTVGNEQVTLMVVRLFLPSPFSSSLARLGQLFGPRSGIAGDIVKSTCRVREIGVLARKKQTGIATRHSSLVVICSVPARKPFLELHSPSTYGEIQFPHLLAHFLYSAHFRIGLGILLFGPYFAI